MLKRTITGIFILLFVVGFTALRLVSAYFFDAFVLILLYGCLFEVAKSYRQNGKEISIPILAIYPIVLFAIYAFSSPLMALVYEVAALIVCFIILMAIELIKNAIKRKNQTQLEGEELTKSLLSETFNTLTILVYPLSILGVLFGINHFGLNLGFVGIIMVFAVSMATDVFAYLFGSLIKGKKMAPEISPNKSISGMIFGAIGGMLMAGLGYLFFVHLGWLGSCFNEIALANKIVAFVLIGVLGTFLTQFGDLVESAIKRKANIKDFGTIFPGHGGFMDRVDGLMFTAALVFVVFTIFII